MRAPLSPTVSISQAAFSVSRRACSISIRRVGDPLLDHALLGQRLAERHPLGDPAAHQLERPLGRADAAHAVVDAAGAEAGLGDGEARRPPRR